MAISTVISTHTQADTATTEFENSFKAWLENDSSEVLSLDDEIVSSQFWRTRQPFHEAGENETLWYLIGQWRSGALSSTVALAWLEMAELLDPDALMCGFAAHAVATLSPTPIPPAAPGGVLTHADTLLETLARVRAA